MAIGAIVVSCVLPAVAVTGPAAAEDTPRGPVDVIVRAEPGRSVAARLVVTGLGGEITHVLPVIDGFVATIDGGRLRDLERSTEIVDVTLDSAIEPQSVDPVLGYDPAETSSMSAITQITGAQAMWNAGYTGQGIDVALIDTGVARVPGLDAAGKVIDGPDLSFDSLEPTLVNTDAFGHGTHMAGIIAGSDPVSVTATTTPSAPKSTRGRKPQPAAAGCATCLGTSPYTDTTKFVGVAPSARIVNVKVGAFDGATDVSQVIAGIDWVVQHRADAGLNIRVINLSFGTDSSQTALLDPLVFAAEQAWRAGIVVVAAAGNDGLAARTLSNPAISPLILAVGASDPRGTLSVGDDSIPTFAQHGDGVRGVDVVAPGVSVVGLRVPGGFADQNVTTGKVGTRFQRASGTSQGTAVVSGMVALLLSKYPSATPDQVKAYLRANATPITFLDALDGVPTPVNKALALALNWYAGSGSARLDPSRGLGFSLPQIPLGTGLGTLEGARGSYHVSNGVAELTGERDIFGVPWRNVRMAGLTWATATWNGGTWNGNRWTGDGWNGARWGGTSWAGTDWTGTAWSGARWGSMTWSNGQWSGARWGGARWGSGTWTGARWGGARWG